MRKSEITVPAGVNRRLTAMWSLSEAGLGGLLHLFKLPFSGILVGGFALVSIAMLAWHNRPSATPIIRSWIVVSAIKFGLSPHSPLTAYIAVSFQAFFSLLCFKWIPHFRSACLLTGAICTVESGIQRILVLTLLFGMGLWKAVDQYTAKILNQFGLEENFSGSQWIVGAYILIHLTAGLLIGWWASRLPEIAREIPPETAASLRSLDAVTDTGKPGSRPPKTLLRQLRTPLFLLLSGGIGTYLEWPVAGLLLRGGGLLALWILVFQGPVQMAVQRLARHLAGGYESEVAEVQAELPALRHQIRMAWKITAGTPGWRRLVQFGSLFVAIGFTGLQNQNN